MSNSYKQTLEMVRKELAELAVQRDSLNARIAALTRTAEGLAALCDESDHSAGLLPESNIAFIASEIGISDAIRDILSDSPLSVPDIRDSLVQKGFDPGHYASILTVIHNTLRRLEKQGQAHSVTTPGGGTKWVAGPSEGGEQPKSHWVSRAAARRRAIRVVPK